MSNYSDQLVSKLDFLLRKNKIINGNFDIWQRNTSQTVGGYGSDDRWSNDDSGSTKTHSQQSFTVGQTDVPGEPTYYSRTVVNSSAGAGNFCVKYQAIESVRTLAGQTATLSFYAKADSSKNIAVEFIQNFGTGGSPSTQVDGIGVTTCALTSSWQKIEVTVNIPSISGKTLGTSHDGYLLVSFWFDAGSSFNARTNSLGQQSGTFDIAQVQLEKGSVATPFEERHVGEELLLCQRYYCKTYDMDTVPGTATTGGSCTFFITNVANSDHSVQIFWKFPTIMRAAPTVTFYSDTSGTSAKVRMASGDVNVVSSGVSDNGVYISATNGSASTMRFLFFQATADAEI